MNIGNIELSAPLALAPMAGITDLPFRLICRRLGCGMTVSEMVSAKGLLYKTSRLPKCCALMMASVRRRFSFSAVCRRSWRRLHAW